MFCRPIFRLLLKISKILSAIFKFIYETIKTFLENSSIHGYHYLADKGLHWTERIFWLICIVVTSTVGALMMIKSTQEYENNPTSVTTDTLYLNWKNRFPAVAFCESSHDFKRETYEKHFNLDPSLDDLTASQILREIIFESVINLGVRCDDSSSYDTVNCLVLKNFTYYTKLLTKSCREIFNYCSWNDREFDCCKKFLPMETAKGTCYVINSIATNPPTGEGEALKFKFNEAPKLVVELKTVEVENYALSLEDVISVRESRSGQILDSYKPTQVHSEIDVFLKFQDTVNEEKVRTVPPSLRGCCFPDECSLKYSPVYSYPGCILDHLGKLQTEKCGCIQHLMPILAREEDKCDNMSARMCLSDHFTDLIKQSSSSKCLSSCVESEIRIVASMSRDCSDKLNYFDKEDTAVRLIYRASPPSLRYFRKLARDNIDLIVNVGGIGTLFYGASVISLVEIAFFLLVFPCIKGFGRKSKRKAGNKTPTFAIDSLDSDRYHQIQKWKIKKNKHKTFPYVN